MLNFIKKDSGSSKCNHNPNDKVFTTLQLAPKRYMVCPQEYIFVCFKCKKGYKFIKGENGEFKIV